VKNLRLLQELEPEDAMKNYEFYCSTILDTIIEHEHVELNFFAIKPENPKIIIINDYLLVHVLEDDAGTFSAFCTMDKRIIDHFNKYFDSLANRREAILSYAAAESMRNTNVQLDSYADSCQTELFNEAPAMLLPTNIMEKLAAGSENEEYGEYLFKLSNIFEKYTSKSDVTLIVYNSVMNEYVHDGNLSIGNVPHRLTREEVRQHIGHLSDIMAENCNFKMFAIRDTVHMGTATKYRPSIFIDQHAVTIENSKRRPNESYHISMNSFFIKMFGKYIGDIEGQANCTQLTRTDLERYL
jgi:hypothetical protein